MSGIQAHFKRKASRSVLYGKARSLLSRGRRLGHVVPTVVGILIINFLLLKIVPGDVADVLAGEAGIATEESMSALRQRLGLDLSLLDQFVAYLSNVAHFSFGQSARFGVPVTDLIFQRLPGTLTLMGAALAMALILGISAGAVMASSAGRLPDRILSVVALLFYSMPGFWIGLMLIVLFSVKLRWLPIGGSETIGSDLTGLAAIADRLKYLVLPATSLALFYAAMYARITRTAMLEVLTQDYVRTAVAKGLLPLEITLRHVLRNALVPITTIAGMHFGGILGGAVVVETVYSWPGLGRLAYEAVVGRDFNVLLGILTLSSLLIVIVNILVDLLQAWLDPRVGDRG